VLLPGAQYLVGSTLNVPMITWQNRIQQRQIQIQFLCTIVEGTQIFRKTRTSEGETWSEVCRRKIQLGVGSKDLDDPLLVNSQRHSQARKVLRNWARCCRPTVTTNSCSHPQEDSRLRVVSGLVAPRKKFVNPVGVRI
jgi:hypothetical protein